MLPTVGLELETSSFDDNLLANAKALNRIVLKLLVKLFFPNKSLTKRVKPKYHRVYVLIIEIENRNNEEEWKTQEDKRTGNYTHY